MHDAAPEDGIAADLALAASLGFAIDPGTPARIRRLLAAHPALDAHCHPGRFFMRGTDVPDPSVSFFAAEEGGLERSLADMRAGGLCAACFALVTDMRSLVLTAEGGLRAARALQPDELVTDTRRQLGEFDRVLAQERVSFARTAAEVRANHREGRISAILTAEGGDFLEGRFERLGEARMQGMRSITICHYRVNEIGDIQTEPPVHGGLSDFGAQLVREMNAAGLIVDLAHASFDTARRAVELATAPVMVSHSHLQPDSGGHPRLLSVEHARMIAGTGGVIGAWPAGVVQRSLGDYADEILRLIDAAGVDHVCLGTDMDANYRPVFDNYRQLPLVLALLAQRGLADAELIKVMGGNFLRVLAACETGAANR